MYFLDLCKQMPMCIILHKLNKVIINYSLLVKKVMSSVNNLFNIYHHDVVIVLSVELWLSLMKLTYVKDAMTLLNHAEWHLFFSQKKQKKIDHYYISHFFCIASISFSASLFAYTRIQKNIFWNIYRKSIILISIHVFASNWYRYRAH